MPQYMRKKKCMANCNTIFDIQVYDVFGVFQHPPVMLQCGQKGYCKHLIKSVKCLAHNQFDNVFALLLYVLIIVNHVHFGE